MAVLSLDIGFLNKIFYWVYARPLWQIVLFMVLAIILWVILASKFSDTKVWRIVNTVGAVGVATVIVYFTIVRRSPSESIKMYLLPWENFERLFLSRGIRESFYLNILMFFPLGLTLPFSLPVKLKHKGLITIVICLAFSVGIEVVQAAFALGNFELADIFANLAGTTIGCFAFWINLKIFRL